MFDRIAEGRWWDRAWSLVEGCTPKGPGCDRCWLRSLDRRFRGPDPLPVRFRADRLNLPLRRKKPTAWAVWSDFFHGEITDADRQAAFAVMRACPQHVFLVLTKRAHALRDLRAVPANCWLGVTVTNQAEADAHVPQLLTADARVHFLSVEPMLGPVDLTAVRSWLRQEEDLVLLRGLAPRIEWVICGGESGAGARTMNPGWAHALRAQCHWYDVPFFFKQWGTKSLGREMDGRTYDALPREELWRSDEWRTA